MFAPSTPQECAANSAELTVAIRHFGSAKEVARIVGCSEATAARYRRGETMPDAVGVARLMGRSWQIALAMLRLAGLDDVSMDLEEARLRQELEQLQAKRSEVPDAPTDATSGAAAPAVVDPRGCLAKAADALSARATRRAARALLDAQRWRR
jgi:transcriptional regulator with XRE-family HTH domain